MDFTNPARAYGLSGVGLMLAPAWDFRVDDFYHGHIAVMRAVEDGYSLARASRRGMLTVADNRGRIGAEIATDAAPFATLLTTIPTGHESTLYLLCGDWFGWCAIAMLALLLVELLRGVRAAAAFSASAPMSSPPSTPLPYSRMTPTLKNAM
jgi:apolipoprotein N-acyltransferase